MKITDFAPRTAVLEYYLKDSKVPLTGAEIGVDAGAHAESMVQWIPIKKLLLIDVWENVEMMRMCESRLKKYNKDVSFIRKPSLEAVLKVQDYSLDFVYFDEVLDYLVVKNNLLMWYPKVAPGGIMCYRNYSLGKEGLFKATNEFIKANKLKHEIHPYHQEICFWRPV